MNNFKRINFLKQEEVNGIIEQDFVHNYWELFEIKRDIQYYTLSREFLSRPDLLSLYLYGNIKYWWILLKVNEIDDVWNDMSVGDVIQVPDINDINDWLINVIEQKRMESNG